MSDEASDDDRLRASLYAATHTGIEGDLAWYRARCAGARRVLDLGCGAGRIAIPLAIDGLDVLGVDRDAALLDIARERARAAGVELELRELDLTELDLRDAALHDTALATLAPFDRILMAHSVAFCFTRAELAPLLARVHALLAPGGELLFDTYPTDAFHVEGDADAHDPFEAIGEVDAAGERYRVLERSDWERDAQRLRALYRYEREGRPWVEITIEHHYLLAAELASLLRAAGFAEVRLRGSWDDAPLDEDAIAMVGVARA